LDPSPSAVSVAKPTKSSGTICFYYKEEGHWKRNCTRYQADKAKSGSGTSNLGTLVVHVVDLYLANSPSSTWVYDTGSAVHICNSMQGLVRNRSVSRGEVDIRVGNKVRVTAFVRGMTPGYPKVMGCQAPNQAEPGWLGLGWLAISQLAAAGQSLPALQQHK
jgi:hypothetical protein